MKTYCNLCNKYGKSTKVKIYNFKKTFKVILFFTVSMVMNIKRYLKKKIQLRY